MQQNQSKPLIQGGAEMEDDVSEKQLRLMQIAATLLGPAALEQARTNIKGENPLELISIQVVGMARKLEAEMDLWV
jgi:hypothetical protein